MVTCVIIDKYGKISEEKLKDNSLQTIAKKCKFRKYEDFKLRQTWKLKINKKLVYVSVFAKNNGRANNENKYDFPPPLDNELYFGSIAIVCHTDKDLNNLIDFNKSLWKNVYEKLMGGFEDLSKEEEEEEEEEEEVDPSQLTKHGYKKDNFIVDESEESEIESGETESGETESGDEEITTGEEEIEYEDTNNEITSEEEIEELEEEEEESVEEYDSVPELSEEEYLSE